MGTGLAIAPVNYSGAQLKLIKTTVAKDCNNDEFDLFVTVARNAGLDPFRKQISALVFSKDDPKKRRMSIVTTIDGLRVIAARSGRYRPDEEPTVFTYDETLKGPANPLGIEKANLRIWIADAMRDGGWRPVAGEAYWEEFAPIVEEGEGGEEWIETGEVWADSGKPKKKKVLKGAVIRKVDSRTQWPKMPRVMLSKCAEAQALRKAFPEDLSGLYEQAEMDQAVVRDITPSEALGEFAEAERVARVGAGGITFQLAPDKPLENIPVGQCADQIIAAVKGFDADTLAWFESANTHPLRELWARAPSDGLGVKKVLEKARSEKAAA